MTSVVRLVRQDIGLKVAKMPAVTASHKPYGSTYSSSYSSRYLSPSSSSSSSSTSSSRNYSYRALSLDRPSASSSTSSSTATSSTARPLSRFTTSSWTSSTSSAGSTFESRHPSSATNRYSSSLSSRPPRPTESKYQYESLAARKERFGSTTSTRDSLASPTSSSSTSSYLRNRDSRLLNNNLFDVKSSSRESSISRDSIGDSWRINRRERSSSRGTTRLDEHDGPGQSLLNQDSGNLSQDSGYNSWGRSSSGKFSPTTSSRYQPVEEEKPRLSVSERKAALENLAKRGSLVDSDYSTLSSSITKDEDSNGNRRPSGPSIKERAALLLDANRNSCEKEHEEDARSTSSASSASSGSSVTARAKSGLSAKPGAQRPFLRTSSPLVNGSYEVDSSDATKVDDGLSRMFTTKCGILVKHPYLETGGQSGLRNIGNTCFMNCIVQCLTSTKPLLEYIIEEKYTGEISSKSRMEGSIVKSFGSLLAEMWKERESYVNPAHFKKCIAKFAPRFMGYDQQDAQEFLRYLLDGLHEDLNRVITKPKPLDGDMDASLSDSQKADVAWKQYLRFDNSRIVDIFVGQLKSTLTCTVCGNGSVTFDPFWDLSLPLPPNLTSSDSVSLTDCLALFSKEEVLDGDEKVECSRCKKLVRATKKLTIQRFPKILVLHLKRFGVDRYRGKLTQKVIYPLTELSLKPYSAPGATSTCGKAGVYNLYGVANHVGSLYRGHYTACCKHPYRGEWFEFDDTMVTKVDGTTDLVTSAAYVLFYELNTGAPKHSIRRWFWATPSTSFIQDGRSRGGRLQQAEAECGYVRPGDVENVSQASVARHDAAEEGCAEPRKRAGAEKKKGQLGETSTATTTPESVTAASILERSRAKRAKMEDDELIKEPNLQEGGLVGLRNLGNTCFMNSVLQCLTKTKPLMDYILKNKHMHELNPDSFSMGTMIRSFGELMTAMWTDEPYSIYMPLKLKKYVAKLAPRFAGYAQQDAQEFLVYLLEGMHEDVNKARNADLPRLAPVRRSLNVRARANEFWRRFKMRENSAIADIFVGQLKSTVQCQECRQASTTFDPFWDLQLAIPPSEDGNVTLEDCLELFTKAETLEGDERVTCSRCKKRTVSTKWFSIQRFPKILVVQLKRFYQTASHQRYKETSRVDFPINFLDLSKFAASTAVSPSKFNLFGVCNHVGILQAGHYTAYCKHPTKEDWFEFDDSRVTKFFSSVGLVSNKAYLLFYEAMPRKVKKPVDPAVRQQQLIMRRKQQQQQRFFAHPRQFVPEVGRMHGETTIVYRLAPRDPPNSGRMSGPRNRQRRDKEIHHQPTPTSQTSPQVLGPVFPSVRSSPEAMASQQSNRTEDDVEEEFNSA